jgi:hypothetical protein
MDSWPTRRFKSTFSLSSLIEEGFAPILKSFTWKFGVLLMEECYFVKISFWWYTYWRGHNILNSYVIYIISYCPPYARIFLWEQPLIRAQNAFNGSFNVNSDLLLKFILAAQQYSLHNLQIVFHISINSQIDRNMRKQKLNSRICGRSCVHATWLMYIGTSATNQIAVFLPGLSIMIEISRIVRFIHSSDLGAKRIVQSLKTMSKSYSTR